MHVLSCLNLNNGPFSEESKTVVKFEHWRFLTGIIGLLEMLVRLIKPAGVHQEDGDDPTRETEPWQGQN